MAPNQALETLKYVHEPRFCEALENRIVVNLPQKAVDGRVVAVDAGAEVGRLERCSRVLGQRGKSASTAAEAKDKSLVHGVGEEGRGVGVVVGEVGVDGGSTEVLHGLGGVLAVGDEVEALGRATKLFNSEPELSMLILVHGIV